MQADLEGVLVTVDAPQGGFHAWPHAVKIRTSLQDPETLFSALWITSANNRNPVDNRPMKTDHPPETAAPKLRFPA
ncbi:hypothetical protein GCM10012278_56470 [Nonomuraea glycinis]|uniref:Uncharacterized protein n=1 Tax=Nonomuraea glycinis TaxID=2047744 RepID=A0A918AB24_9ACTN|nr:hypothetical protein GCM10012278_56470 [Nonomuraea glycinis]